MNCLYMVKAVLTVSPKDASFVDPIMSEVAFCIPFRQVRRPDDPSVFQADLRLKTLRHLMTKAAFHDRDHSTKLAEIFSRGPDTYSVQFNSLEYSLVTEYNQWLPTEYPKDLEQQELMTSWEIERAASARNIATTMLQMREVYHGAVSCLAALMASKTPVWDGDVPSKSGRDHLLEMGLGVRTLFNHEDGYTAVTYLGREVHNEIVRQRAAKAAQDSGN